MTNLCRSIPIVAAAILGANPLAAQTTKFPTSDATIQRIWRLGMDSSHVQQLSQTLFDSIRSEEHTSELQSH